MSEYYVDADELIDYIKGRAYDSGLLIRDEMIELVIELEQEYLYKYAEEADYE